MMDEPDYCYLTTTGRLTGKPHTVELWFVIEAGSLFLMHEGSSDRPYSDWIRNLLRTPGITIRIGTSDAPAVGCRARLSGPGSAEERRGRALLVAKYRSRWSGDLASWGRNGVVVVVDLPPSWDFHAP
jgi:hypothetical protein